MISVSGTTGQETIGLLSAMAGELGYELIVVDKIKDGARDISSTYIREEIAARTY